MNIELFKTFIVVTRLESIYKAGEEIYLTQPAVTKQIQALEQHYSVKLFERSNKKLTLTEEGKHLLEYAYRIVSLYKESIESVNEKQDQVKGTLRIMANLTLGIYVLPKVIKPFHDTYPDLKIEMFLDNTEHIISAVKQGNANFGFIGIPPKEPLIALHLFYHDKLKVVVGPNMKINKVVSWNELASLPFVQRERGSDIRETYEQWFKERDIKLTSRMESNNTEAIKYFVHYGMGFSILPCCTIEQESRAGLLRVVSVPSFELTQNYYICNYKGKKLSRPEKVFFEYIFNSVESGKIPILSAPKR